MYIISNAIQNKEQPKNHHRHDTQLNEQKQLSRVISIFTNY